MKLRLRQITKDELGTKPTIAIVLPNRGNTLYQAVLEYEYNEYAEWGEKWHEVPIILRGERNVRN